MVKSTKNRAWFLVIPALMLLGFVAVIPLIMVVNYSFHDIITLNSKVWVGFEWYREVLRSSRFWESLIRSLLCNRSQNYFKHLPCSFFREKPHFFEFGLAFHCLTCYSVRHENNLNLSWASC